MADPISGELVIVPDAEAVNSLKNYLMEMEMEIDWSTAVSYAAEWSDGTNTDYRLPTKAEAMAIFGNAALVEQLTLDFASGFWTIEEYDVDNAWRYALTTEDFSYARKFSWEAVLPVRKVNFYGLPLIGSEYGVDGLVYDVVAETRTVHIVARWSIVVIALGSSSLDTWDAAMALFPVTLENTFTSMPTRAQALKIFGNSYLITLAGLPVEYYYWTSEEQDLNHAYSIQPYSQGTFPRSKYELFLAIPVRSEVVPET